MSYTIKKLLDHRSIRKFKSDPVSEEQLREILNAAQAASTSNNMQAYSIITVRDYKLKEQLAELSGNQQSIKNCPLFLVWCADLYRTNVALSEKYPHIQAAGSVEHLISSTVDTSLAAQNAVIAAESLGLGIVYIGGIRNDIDQVAKLLNLPKLVYPVFGLCIGVPNEEPVLRPRLSHQIVVHENYYNSHNYKEFIQKYDSVNKEYTKRRSNGKESGSWTSKLAEKLSRPRRENLKNGLANRGFYL
ncbi:oxygen-insensitive NADPH nitroreductase [Metabacillus fastidiosus]|uniref:oxygen-insensitive NADPH nitroreductase n=1 Tax=Metabacillus fastidiosus TaxID=1458 RepID=UPI003D2A6023